MTRRDTIHIPELRRIIDELLRHVELVHGPEIVLQHDFYWDLSDPELWDVSHAITAVEEVGSLCDDLEFLRSMSDIVEGGSALNLIHAAPLLKYIGEKLAA